jgi:hypothetical protein
MRSELTIGAIVLAPLPPSMTLATGKAMVLMVALTASNLSPSSTYFSRQAFQRSAFKI